MPTRKHATALGHPGVCVGAISIAIRTLLHLDDNALDFVGLENASHDKDGAAHTNFGIAHRYDARRVARTSSGTRNYSAGRNDIARGEPRFKDVGIRKMGQLRDVGANVLCAKPDRSGAICISGDGVALKVTGEGVGVASHGPLPPKGVARIVAVYEGIDQVGCTDVPRQEKEFAVKRGHKESQAVVNPTLTSELPHGRVNYGVPRSTCPPCVGHGAVRVGCPGETFVLWYNGFESGVGKAVEHVVTKFAETHVFEKRAGGHDGCGAVCASAGVDDCVEETARGEFSKSNVGAQVGCGAAVCPQHAVASCGGIGEAGETGAVEELVERVFRGDASNVARISCRYRRVWGARGGGAACAAVLHNPGIVAVPSLSACTERCFIAKRLEELEAVDAAAEATAINGRDAVCGEGGADVVARKGWGRSGRRVVAEGVEPEGEEGVKVVERLGDEMWRDEELAAERASADSLRDEGVGDGAFQDHFFWFKAG
jgi:hypothetical protein